MYIETKEIGPEGLDIDRLIGDIASLPLEGSEEVHVRQVHLSGRLLRERGGIAFEGDIETVAALACCRCLESYQLPLQLHFDLLYTTEPEASTKGESKVHVEEITRTRYDGVRIDLRELLSEQIYLGMPLKPLCRAECLGLCPRCGANLNQAACSCREERTGDPRLKVLKKLL
jgi:uncharacterized protein